LLCGFAASRAESPWLSVKPQLFSGYAARGEASPFLRLTNGKPEAFRTERGAAAKPIQRKNNR